MAQEPSLCLQVETKAAPLLGVKSPSPASSSDSHESLCYICHAESENECLVSNICACKEQKVHARCLATWLHYSAARRDGDMHPKCEVCLEPYNLPKSMRVLVYPGRRALPPPRHQHDIFYFTKCANFAVPAVFALLYGFSFSMLTPSMDSIVYVCAAGNAVIVLLWIYFVVRQNNPPATRLEEKKAVEDVVVLILVYVIFVMGWALHELSLPKRQPNLKFAAFHIANAGAVMLSTVVRLAVMLCRQRPCMACCRPTAEPTISLDLGE